MNHKQAINEIEMHRQNISVRDGDLLDAFDLALECIRKSKYLYRVKGTDKKPRINYSEGT